MAHVSKALVQLPTKPHALYRFYDRTDALLYVGITMGLPARVSQHRKAKPWWAAVQHMTVEWRDSREAALEAEARAIQEEKPLYNVTHNELVHAPGGGTSEVISDWRLVRRALATDIVDTIGSILGDERLTEAHANAQRDLALTGLERRDPLEVQEVVVAALQLVEAIAGDLWRFRLVTEDLLTAIPAHIRAYCEEEAAQDWMKATGQPAPNRLDVLPDILRYIRYTTEAAAKGGGN